MTPAKARIRPGREQAATEPAHFERDDGSTNERTGDRPWRRNGARSF